MFNFPFAHVVYIFITCILIVLILIQYINNKKLTTALQNLAHANEEAQARHELELEHTVQERLAQSRRVLKGKISEELFPLLAACPYLPADMRFFGNPIDYVVFHGLSAAKDDREHFDEIVFLDVKTGNARLSQHQRKIKQAVKDGRVRWETVRVHDDGTLTFERD